MYQNNRDSVKDTSQQIIRTVNLSKYIDTAIYQVKAPNNNNHRSMNYIYYQMETKIVPIKEIIILNGCVCGCQNHYKKLISPMPS